MAGIAAPRGLTAAQPGRRGRTERTVRFALPADDAALRSLLRRSVIPGAVRVAFTREPSYSAGEGVAGATDATILTSRAGAATGMGRCGVHTLHRNGGARRIGYLAELRLDPATPPSARSLLEGYTLLREAAERAGVEGFFTSITVDNARARRVLENGGRLGLPTYRPLCQLVTFLAPVAPGTSRDAGTADVSPSIDELTAFLARHAREAQLTLTWDEARWRALAVHGITPRDFAVVRRGGRIVAAAAVWDQRAFRQTVIDGYARGMHLARPVLNAGLALVGRPRLPDPGAVLAQGALLGAYVDDVGDWPTLWSALRTRAAARGLEWLALARDRRDAFCVRLRRLLRAREYHTTLYDVSWRDRPEWNEPWDARLFRPEVGLL